MMKRGGIQKNNRGDSLILVIGCIALLSVLGIVILAKSVDNQTMKLAERNAQESFFAADSTSAEVATVLEAVALEAIEDAFSDMLVEYSNSGNDTARKQRYETYFLTRLDQKLKKNGDNKLETLLAEALGLAGGSVTNVSISYDNPVSETDPTDTTGSKTDIIKIKNVQLTYTANGSETTITTDISVQTQIPDVTGGFRPSVDCFFSDFTLISDGTVSMVGEEGATVAGNMYSGDDLKVSGSSSSGVAFTLNVANASKVLVKDTIQVDGGAKLDIKNGSVPTTDEPSVWANDISVIGGGLNPSILSTKDMNIYVSDDMTIDGVNSEIEMKGDAEYVGFSGGIGTAGLPNYKKSSAITINSAKNLKLDLSGLQRIVLTGTSFIHEPGWKDASGADIAEGIMQGESVAYKDMQMMYLVPNECMAAGHNPVMPATESTNAILDSSYMLGTKEIVWADYLATPQTVTHTLLLDNGITKVTYVYLNFKNETMAALYAKYYLESTTLGTAVKERATHLGTGDDAYIKFPEADKVKARGEVLTYDGATVDYISASTSDLSVISTTGLSARLAYAGLFTSLQAGGGGTLKSDYKMVADGIASLSGVTGSYEVERVEIAHPITGSPCFFYFYKGDLTIGAGSDTYKDVDGILLVDGNVTYSLTNATVDGLVLATGTVTIKNSVTFTPDEDAVEALLADERVAKYFRGVGDSEQNYLSSEAVDITFENWKRN